MNKEQRSRNLCTSRVRENGAKLMEEDKSTERSLPKTQQHNQHGQERRNNIPKKKSNTEVPDLVEETDDQIGVRKDKKEDEELDNNIQQISKV